LPKDGSIPPTSLHGQSGDVRIKPSLGKRTSNEIYYCNARPCGRNFESLGFWDSSVESDMIHRTPTESEAGADVDKDG
jgi:hypothetical protein